MASEAFIGLSPICEPFFPLPSFCPCFIGVDETIPIDSMDDDGFELQLNTSAKSSRSNYITISCGSFTEEDTRMKSRVRINREVQYMPHHLEQLSMAAPPSKDELWYNDADYDQFEYRYNYQMKKLAAKIDGEILATTLGLAKRYDSPRRVRRQQSL
uniref:Uncharacterized protein n=1 Tax=Eucampia antarctica TaxID=49252 RepID=A0A7S2SG71_9STRA|mmetsp:Transcript_7832/g.7401  ORF Transcript_7832/g.7401 Transcript_7832/m.7401 type:complete len:157 (+) Transcript_7832:157-627(+)|eukprot:CAMPEP_0197837150 /NCGR_PEP_ID=MMETSP1437-20131217/31266_1 /TAXON_ID=49252 ORGANISM="Eucampia antarctica, Strain CCMP1452" /NCGR_SAMPLE_ID=MMETSP1437 /ASSEMBLY_ACC=CAM_ASM_001096 /LENGTH=156 /DNA_ID=CAMNT_0043443949 /DNA_START=59 /DNA_END=529 /DNA_ORIENTATION=+